MNRDSGPTRVSGLSALVLLPRPLLLQIFSHFSLLELHEFVQLAPVFSWVLEDEAFEVLMKHAIQRNPSLMDTFTLASKSCIKAFPGIEGVVGPMLQRLRCIKGL